MGVEAVNIYRIRAVAAFDVSYINARPRGIVGYSFNIGVAGPDKHIDIVSPAKITRECYCCGIIVVIESHVHSQRILRVGNMDFQRGAVFEDELHLNFIERVLAGQDEVMSGVDRHGFLLLGSAVQDNFSTFAGDFFHGEEAGSDELNALNVIDSKAAAIVTGQAELRDQRTQQDLGSALNNDLRVTVMELHGVGYDIRGEPIRENEKFRQDPGLLHVIRIDAFDFFRSPAHNMVNRHRQAVYDGILRSGQIDRVGERHRHFVQRSFRQKGLVDRDVQADIAGSGGMGLFLVGGQGGLCSFHLPESGDRKDFLGGVCVLEAKRLSGIPDQRLIGGGDHHLVCRDLHRIRICRVSGFLAGGI